MRSLITLFFILCIAFAVQAQTPRKTFIPEYGMLERVVFQYDSVNQVSWFSMTWHEGVRIDSVLNQYFPNRGLFRTANDEWKYACLDTEGVFYIYPEYRSLTYYPKTNEPEDDIITQPLFQKR